MSRARRIKRRRTVFNAKERKRIKREFQYDKDKPYKDGIRTFSWTQISYF